MTTLTAAVVDIADHRSTKDLARITADLETLRAYLAGPCNQTVPTAPRCPRGRYNGHQHWTPWYEHNRSVIVQINSILAADFPRSTWAQLAATIDPWED